MGDPVAGVKVTFDGKSATTSAKGVAVITLAKGVRVGGRTAAASRTGWRSGTVTIRTT